MQYLRRDAPLQGMTSATTWETYDEAGGFFQWANLDLLVLCHILIDGAKFSISLSLLSAPLLYSREGGPLYAKVRARNERPCSMMVLSVLSRERYEPFKTGRPY